MKIRVLVVDDSSFFRRQICKILESDPNLEVVDTASNGQEAVEKTLQHKPNVITMDVEMPVMDGITAVKLIMEKQPTPVLMFSSLTVDGAKATINALEAGAVDFIPKKFEEIARDKAEISRVLCEHVRSAANHKPKAISSVLRSRASAPPPAPKPKPVVSAAPVASPPRVSRSGKHFELFAIGTSTGGPLALQEVLSKLPKTFPVPIVLVQHMPSTFTKAFAERLDQLCEIHVCEAEDGQILKPGTAYLAPGGKQLEVKRRGDTGTIHIFEGDSSLTYRPCVDLTFSSLAESYKDKVLAIVLTGMGRDGCEGAKKLKQSGSVIWAQDEETCVVYGMPAAIVDAGLAEKVLSIHDVSSAVIQQIV